MPGIYAKEGENDDDHFVTLQEFEAQKAELACQACGAVGLDLERNANNGGVRPICPQCGSKAPLAGVQWLRQNGASARRPRRPPGDPSPDEVWAANGDHCAFCGKNRELCQRLGIGITSQHVVPFVDDGSDSPLIPFCARCQQASVAALAETHRIRDCLVGLDQIIRRMEEKHPELRAP